MSCIISITHEGIDYKFQCKDGVTLCQINNKWIDMKCSPSNGIHQSQIDNALMILDDDVLVRSDIYFYINTGMIKASHI